MHGFADNLLVNVVNTLLSTGQGVEDNPGQVHQREVVLVVPHPEPLSVNCTDRDGVLLRIHFSKLGRQLVHLATTHALLW